MKVLNSSAAAPAVLPVHRANRIFKSGWKIWSAREVEPGVVQLTASAADDDGPVTLDLILREQREPILHGDAGLSRKGPEPGNANYYYSLVGLETTGMVEIGGRKHPVTGLSWMDHEFGTSALSENAVGWDWFSAQLDNGAALMFAQIRTVDGKQIGDFEGTLVLADGRHETIGAQDLEIEILDRWTSDATGITYPSGWQVSIPKYALELRFDPLIAAQEMAVSYVYREGAVEVDGTMDNEPVAGQGYVELTGYGAGQSGYQR